MKSLPQSIKLAELEKIFAPFKAGVKRRRNGALPYDYLVPAGVYQEQWDWDAFFMGLALSSEIPSEAIYVKNWVLNYIINAREDGFSPGCVTPQGRDERLNQMKPLLAQGALLASQNLEDFSWIIPYYSRLKKIVLYREKYLWNKKYNLAVWFDSMESGADNNVAALDFPNKTVIATDVNSFLYREYKALSQIAKKLGKEKDAKLFSQKAHDLKNAINNYLWDSTDETYYNLNSQKEEFIKRVSYNCVHPLWAGIASKKRADSFIARYLLNTKKLLSPYGIRTLSQDDPEYNNVNMIKPYSNWQGPIWPIANYFYTQALLQYGYQKEAAKIAEIIADVCIQDIKKTGGMHENYDAETGKPLAAPNFISWNLLVPVMVKSALEKTLLFPL